MPGHPPDLPGHFDAGGFAIGPGDRDHGFGKRRKKARGQLRKGLPGLGSGDMHRAIHFGLNPGDYGHGSGSNRGRDKVFAIDNSALKRAEHGSGGDLTVVDRESGDLCLARPCQRNSRLLGQCPQLHSLLPLPTSGARSVISTSRVSSGIIPSSGPIRGTSRPTTGAAFQAAVR